MKPAQLILFSTPGLVVWAILLYRVFTGHPLPVGFASVLMGLSFIGFTGSIAMLFVKPASKEWRAAAIFNAFPFILIVIWVSLLANLTSD